MMSLLINKKSAATILFVLSFFLTSSVEATFSDKDVIIETIEIKDIPADNIYHPGGSLNTSCRVKNNESFEIDTYKVCIYAGDYQIGGTAYTRIKGGVSKTFDITCTLPNNIPYGSYSIWGKIDFMGGYYGNNTASTSPDIIVAEGTIDLQMESIGNAYPNADNTYYGGDPFYISAKVKNIGEMVSNAYSVDVYAGSYLLGQLNYSNLNPGKENVIIKEKFYLPNDIIPGNYNIHGEVTCSNDIDSSNNTANISSDIIVGALFVDLNLGLVDAERPSNNIFYKGFNIKVGGCLYNEGKMTSGSYNAKFYIGDYFIGSDTRPPVERDAKDYCGGTFTIPVDIPVGYQDLICEIECPNDIDLSNNRLVSWKQIIIDEPFPEISLIGIESNGSNFRQGDTISVATSIGSSGNLSATNICVEYYANEFLIGSTSRSDLEPGKTDTFTEEIHIPDDLPDGYYSLAAIVTCTDDKNTNNNAKNTGTTFWVGKLFDLEVKSVQAANGTFIPKDTIDIYSLVENVGDKISNAYTIDFYMSADKNITAMDYRIGMIERKSLEPGAQHSYNTTFKIPPNLPVGNYYVGVRIICQEEGNYGNNSGYDNETVGIVHPANYVCGHITYEYTGQNNQAVRYALLKIIDAGTNRVIAQTYTDENGNYGEVVLRDEMSPGSVYVKVYAESVIGAYPGTKSKICSVKSDADKHLYSRQSPDYSHAANSSRIIDYTVPIVGRAIMVFDSMVEAFIHAKEYFGIEMEPITAYWPSNDDGTYYYPGEGIFISYDDEWDRDIILHEYGHYIAEVYDFCQGSVGENPTHAWNVDLREFPVQRTAEHAANLAFRESWPTLFAIASQYYNSVYPRSGDTKYHDYYSYYNWSYEYDLEEDTFDKGSPGEFYDNMNCCALWDIFDNNPDNINFSEEVNDPNLTKIWSVIRSYKPEDMNDFWVGWFHHFGQNEDKEGIIDILQEHRMSFAQSGIVPQVPQNHAPVANAGQDKTVSQDGPEGALVHLNASDSSDSDGDVLNYVWRYGYIKYSGKQVDIVLPAGRSEIELEVSDGKITAWDTVIFTVSPN